jgi:hypothetical protein
MERLFCEILHQRAQRPFEQWLGGTADFGMNADQVQQRVEHVRPDL